MTELTKLRQTMMHPRDPKAIRDLDEEQRRRDQVRKENQKRYQYEREWTMPSSLPKGNPPKFHRGNRTTRGGRNRHG